MIKTIYFQRYHMELALIMYLCENDSHARFIRNTVQATRFKQDLPTYHSIRI